MRNTIGNLPGSVDDSGEERLTSSSSPLGGIEVLKEIDRRHCEQYIQSLICVASSAFLHSAARVVCSGWLHERL